ncbi:hypothetical protein PMAYCL1PPCAC_09244, partial [Pristionchus mayeri]
LKPITTFDHCLILRQKNSYMVYHVDEEEQSFETLSQLVDHYAGSGITTNVLVCLCVFLPDRRTKSTISLSFSINRHEYVLANWDHKNNKIEKGQLIGDGFFGKTFKGVILDNEVVALKTPNLRRMNADEFINEAQIAWPCKHPNVLETIGICTRRYYIITEYMANGNLKKYFENNELSLENCLSISRKVASGMEYLASMHIVHRDLAARSILIRETLDVI